jgi:hypothetical protein
MSRIHACLVVLCALPALGSPAFAQNQNQNQNQNKNQTQNNQTQRPAVVQQRPAASQQANYANQGTAQANHVFDGRQKPANPVVANTGPKPNPVGQSTSLYKPQQHLHTNPVPSPTVTRSTTTATTQTVSRSTTTATVPPKKP